MGRARISELAAVLRLMRDVQEASDRRDFEQRLLEGLARVIPSDILSYNEIEPRRRRAYMVTWPVDITQDGRGATFERLSNQHPLIGHYARTGDTRALRISDFLSQRQFHALALYQEFYRPLEVEHQLAFTISARSSLVIGIALNRARSTFTERERQLLNLLRPTIAAAQRAATERVQVRALLETFEAVANRRGEAYLAIDSRPRIVAASAGALSLLERYVPAGSGDHTLLPEPFGAWLRAAGGRRGAPSAPGPALVLGGPEGRLLVRFLERAAPEGRDVLVLREELAGPTVRDRPHEIEPGRLTRREVEVVELVAKGLTNREIGSELRVGSRTVQRHLDHVYAKLGVHSRAAAVRVLLEAGSAATERW